MFSTGKTPTCTRTINLTYAVYRNGRSVQKPRKWTVQAQVSTLPTTDLVGNTVVTPGKRRYAHEQKNETAARGKLSTENILRTPPDVVWDKDEVHCDYYISAVRSPFRADSKGNCGTSRTV